jgi:hypothetical protein
MGYHTEYQALDMGMVRFGVHWSQNIVATLTGQTLPDEVVIVGAHYDSRSEIPYQLAPGANDNGSGVGSMLEVRCACPLGFKCLC